MNYDFMVPIYVTLIKMGRKTIDDVPAVLKDKVTAALNEEA